MQLINELRYNINDFNSLQEGDLIVVFDGYINVINSNDGNDTVALNILKKLCKTFTSMTPNIFNNDGTLRSLFERDIKDAILQFEGFPKLLIGEVFNDENNEFTLSIDNNSYDVYNSKELHYLVKSGLLNNKFNSIYINDVKYPINKFGNKKDKSMDSIPIANPMYHGTCEAFLYSILIKGLRKMQSHSAFSVDNEGFVFLTSDYKAAFYYAKMYERETKSNQVVIEIDTSQIDRNKIVLDYDFVYSFATPGDKNPFNKEEIGSYHNYKGPVATTSKNYGSKFGKIGYKGIIMPNAIKKIYIYDNNKQIHQFTKEEYINYYKKNHMNENLLREKQFGVFNEINNRIGLIEQRIIESPDTAISPNGGHIFYNERQAIPFIITNDFSNCYLGDSAWTHDDIVAYDEENDTEISVMDDLGLNRANAWLGRLWMKDKVISIWRIPTADELVRIIHLLSHYIHEDLYEWYIDINDDEPTLIWDYIEGNNSIDNEQQFDTSVLHLKNGNEKSQDPQMQAYLKSRAKNQADKLGVPNNKREVSPAEYNYYKRYNMGESKINEVSISDISLKSFETHKELHPKIWVNNKLNSRVRLRLLDIADDFIDTLAVNWVKPTDIVFTGSLANYNWSKHSDIDVHILMDYNKVYKKKEFVEDYFNAKKDSWLENHPDLKIYGFPVELYVEDTNGDSTSTGIYSLNKNKWIKEPEDFQDVKLNEKYIKKQSSDLMTQIDDLIKKYKNETDEHKIESISKKLHKIFNKVKNFRKEGLSKKGEMSSGNIIYKILRRTKYLDKIWDIIYSSYDKINSLNEKTK